MPADTYALAKGVGGALSKAGGDTWFFITADYEFGYSLQSNTEQFIKEAGGKVLGSVRAPLGTADFSSYLVQAAASGAKVIGLANAGTDLQNCIKQAAEFGIVKKGQRLATLLMIVPDVLSLGQDVCQGLVLTNSFYWDQSPADTRLDGTVRREDGQAADRIQRWGLCRRDALAEGGEGHQHAGRRCYRGENARDSAGRFLQQQRPHHAERLRAAHDVSVGGEAGRRRRSIAGMCST